MNTALRTRGPCWLRVTTWRMISPTLRLRHSPPCPVAQKAHPTTQPTWLETQAVNESPMLRRTHSTAPPAGVSSSSFCVTNGVALFRGKVSLENNGGFASVRSLLTRHDLAGGNTVVVRVRGDGRRYKFTARMDRSFDSAVHQCVFTTKKGAWEEHHLSFKEFVPTFRGRVLSDEPLLDPAKVTSVGFMISDKQAGVFQLEVAWVKTAVSAPQ